jgi:hypothetical protein
MLRQWIISVSLLLATGLAQAGEAGRIVFVTGEAHSANRAVALGDLISEGDEITTGKDGYVYLKTIDNGFLILRPASRARIVTYHVDLQNPGNTRIKLELLSGVARSISGQAVKQARQNFRFNTPVAAIGVRGTDFTVFTDQETSRVAVISGGIVVSGFAGSCRPDGGGPCEGNGSHELSAAQVGQLLQVRRGQTAPQLLNGNVLPADVVAPQRSDEPISKNGPGAPVLASNDLSLDPQKNANLLLNVPPPVIVPPLPPMVEPPPSPPPPVVPPPMVEPPPAVPPPPPQRQIIWGRWQPILDQAAVVDLSKESKAGAQTIAIKGNFALLRSAGSELQLPERGSVGFSLKQSEAVILDEPTLKYTVAGIENGQLNVDFGKKTFNTSFDLVSQAERFKLQSEGVLKSDGRLFGNDQFNRPTNINVTGVLGPDNGSTAAYVFQGRLDAHRVASGVTYWGK